jgi:hypothetical protein
MQKNFKKNFRPIFGKSSGPSCGIARLLSPLVNWEPIAIDQGHPSAQEPVERLQETTVAIEQDNGYSATCPQERYQVAMT